MKNKGNSAVVVLLIILIGLVSGVGILIGINNAVGNALRPVDAKISDIQRSLKDIENKIDAKGSEDSRGTLSSIQNALSQINSKLSGINQRPNGPSQPQEDMNKVYSIPVGISTIIGKKDAPITIVEFSDFQCPFCARFYPVAKQVLDAYPNQVRLIVKNFPLPFHPNARPAAKLALAANEQGKFQGMMEALLANGGDYSDAKVKQYAQSLGLDYNKLMADYKNKDAQWESQIKDDMQLAQNVDVRGTPTFYLNGKKTNSRDLNSFKSEIDAILNGKK